MLVPVLTGGQTPTSRPASQQPQQTPPEPPSIAVLDFDVIGSGLDLAVGEALASVIQSALVRGGGLRVIERSKLAAVLTEQDLQVTNLVDPSTAVEIGRIAGVDRLVLGNLAAVEDTHTVTCRVIDVTTGLDTKKKKRMKTVRRTAEPWAKVNRIWVTREVHRKVPGILVHAALELGNCKGASLRAVAQFFDARTDEPLENRGRPYFALGGRVVSERSFSPRYRFSTYGDFGIFIPRAQLRLPRGKSTVKCRVILLDDSRGRPQRLAGSDEVTFTVGG